MGPGWDWYPPHLLYQASQLDYSSLPPYIFYFVSCQGTDENHRQREVYQGFLSPTPFACFPSHNCCVFLFYFRIRFIELTQYCNQQSTAQKLSQRASKGQYCIQESAKKPWNNGHEQLQWIFAASILLCR